MRSAVWQLVEPFVIPHRERHVALLTLEASFVPYLEQIQVLREGTDCWNLAQKIRQTEYTVWLVAVQIVF